MKKKIGLLLCVHLIVFCFVGCGKKEASLSAEQKEAMNVHSEILLQLCMDPESLIGMEKEEFYATIDSYSEFEINSFLLSLNNYLSQYGIPSMKMDGEKFTNVFDVWEAALDECGELKNLGELKVDEKKLTVSVKARFEEREATITFAFDEDLKMKSLDVAAKYSLGEILTKAGLNTVLGMGVVFAVLIFLAFLIDMMKYIPSLAALFKKKKTIEKMPEQSETEIKIVADLVDDLELIAVITAVIAAQEGTSTDGFVVRSIRRRPSNGWS